MQVTGIPFSAGILMLDGRWLIWEQLTEAIQRALSLLMSPIPPLLVPLHADIPIRSSFTPILAFLLQFSTGSQNH